jgi:hypothetical protein
MSPPDIRLAILCVFLLLGIDGAAQQIQNVRADFDGEKAIIVYDMIAEQDDDRFNVQLFSSHDNYHNPLSLLIGDAGQSVQPGASRRITWDAKSSLPADFDGDVTFKVRASLTVTLDHPTRLEIKPLNFAAYKRGGKLNMEWNGGKEGDSISIELFKGNNVVREIAEVENKHIFSWSIPGKLKPGKGYSIRISKLVNADIQSMSQPFEIRPRMSMWVKLIPVAIAGGVIAFLSGSEDPKEEEPDLPGPITPGG